MVTKIMFVFIVFVGFVTANIELRQRHPDVGLNAKRLIKKYGYPFEKHRVTTEDGYVLEMHRIPYGRNGRESTNRSVALLVPGILCGSADWVNMGPEKSLGFILADKGYDVWLANYRGTTWSRKHVSLNPDQDKKEFWNYSFHEIGIYDVPAFIDYILNVTNEEKLFYIGHSQGSTSFFALTSEKPQYNSKIRLATTLAPVVYLEHSKSPMMSLLTIFQEPLKAFVEKHEFYELLPHSRLLSILGQMFCNDDSPFQIVCAAIFYFAGGYSPDQLNKTMIPVIVSNTPAGSSVKQIQHYVQLTGSHLFQQYDYGEDKNMIQYGTPTPPEYDLSKITSPVALVYGGKDLVCAIKDMERLAAELPNMVAKRFINAFNHLDYMWGIDAVKLLYNDLLDLMERY